MAEKAADVLPGSSLTLDEQKQGYQKGGTLGIKGITYQLKWLMLFLHRGYQKQYKFRLATEMEAAEKFDDIVFEYTEEGKKFYRFIQIKHKEGKTKCITWEGLLTDSDNDYGLLKYFNAYRKIKEKPEFKAGVIKDFVICTNVNFEKSIYRKERFCSIETGDDILTLEGREAELLKLNNIDEVFEVLKNNSGLEMLAQRLAECVLYNKPIEDSPKKYPIFKKFGYLLANDVIDVESKKFQVSFLTTRESQNLPEIINTFRNVFKNKLKNESRIKKRKTFHLNCKKDVFGQLQDVVLNLPETFQENKETRPLSDALVTDEEIRKFLSLLVFAVNQPDELELGELIKTEIGKEFSFLNSEDDYNRLFVKMLDWMKENDGRYQSWEDAEFIFKEAKRGLSVWFDVTESVKNFTGRKQELLELHSILQNGTESVNTESVTVTACICGMGGVGKSELVRKYIQKHSSDYDYNVIWIHAETRKSIENSFILLAKDKLRINTESSNGKSKEIKSIVDDVYRCFSRKKCLIVFDNATQYRATTEEGIDIFLPSMPEDAIKPYIIVTSQNQEWRNQKFKIILLNVFSANEANDFITNALPSSIETGRTKLADSLGHFPLALQQAVAYIKEEDEELKLLNPELDFTIEEYLLEFCKKEKELLDFHFPDDSCDTYTKTTLTTWNIALDKIKSNTDFGEQASEIMEAIAYFAPDNIPAKIFFHMFEKDDRKLPKTLKMLKKYSLIGSENGLLNIHRLAQKVIKIGIHECVKDKIVIDKCIYLLMKEFPVNRNLSEDCAKKRQLMPHLESLLKNVEEYKSRDEDLIENKRLELLYNCLGDVYGDLGFVSKERDMYQKLLYLVQREYGMNHLNVAYALIGVGTAEGDLGHFEAEINYIERALTIFDEKLLETPTLESPDVCRRSANAYEKLSLALTHLGRKTEATEYLNQALKIKKLMFGSDHYEYAHTLTQLAVHYGRLGYHSEEKRLLEKVLPILQNHYGSEHYMIGQVLGMLGAAYSDLGNQNEALDLLKRSRCILEAHYGPDHFQVGQTLGDLGVTYWALKRFNEAKECLERQVQIFQNHYGADHLEVSVPLKSLSAVYGFLGERCLQREALNRTLRIQEQHLGAAHEEVQRTLLQLLVGQNVNECTFKIGNFRR